MTRLARCSWAVLVYNVAVVAWGAYVRATRSGAGCGAHWPLCNGEMVPQAPTVQMLVEFSHRVTSGLALLTVVALVAWTWKACRPGHPARRGAAWAMVFMLTEAGVGALLVLFRLVADNASMARALFMSIHLTNTFLLLGSLALTAHWLSGGAPVRLQTRGPLVARTTAGAVALMISGISGAVAALGDTLYPSGSLAAALSAEFSTTSHVLVRLRLLHPAIAVLVGMTMIVAGTRVAVEHEGAMRRLGAGVALAAGLQLAAGFVNVALLAPVWMQMVHVVIADTLWIGFALMSARLLAWRSSDAVPSLARG